jgi:hypothetical protein
MPQQLIAPRPAIGWATTGPIRLNPVDPATIQTVSNHRLIDNLYSLSCSHNLRMAAGRPPQ